MTRSKRKNLIRRKTRVRSKILGSKKRPRIIVYRSNRYIYAQAIDDESSKIIASSSDLSKGKKTEKKTTKSQKSNETGKSLALLLKKKKISKIVFDRGGYKYHGRVKSFAEGLKEGGVKF